jgi:serine/threonine-protein kinase RsbW
LKTNFIREYILTEIGDIKVATDGVMSEIEGFFMLSDARKYEIRLVLNELLVNCFAHSYSKEIQTVVLKVSVKENEVCIRVKDSGQGFEYEDTNKRLRIPISKERLYSENGRGLMLVNAFCSNVKYFGNGNSVEVSIALQTA